MIVLQFLNKFYVLRNEMSEKLQIENNYQEKIRKSKNSIAINNKKSKDIDVIRDYPQKINNTPLMHTVTETDLNDCYLKNNNLLDGGTISSVTSWTSSSDDILCSNNSRVIKKFTSYCYKTIYIRTYTQMETCNII